MKFVSMSAVEMEEHEAGSGDGEDLSSLQLTTDGECVLYIVNTTHCTHYCCDIVTHYHEARLTKSKKKRQRKQRTGYAKPSSGDGEDLSSLQLTTADGECVLYIVNTTHCTHYCCDIVTHYHKARLTKSKKRRQRQQRTGYAKDVQISQLKKENELVQDKCKYMYL